jgi:hypothetical protein
LDRLVREKHLCVDPTREAAFRTNSLAKTDLVRHRLPVLLHHHKVQPVKHRRRHRARVELGKLLAEGGVGRAEAEHEEALHLGEDVVAELLRAGSFVGSFVQGEKFCLGELEVGKGKVAKAAGSGSKAGSDSRKQTDAPAAPRGRCRGAA